MLLNSIPSQQEHHFADICTQDGTPNPGRWSIKYFQTVLYMQPSASLCSQHKDKRLLQHRLRKREGALRTTGGLCCQLSDLLGGRRQETPPGTEDSTPGVSEQKGWANCCFYIAIRVNK